MKWILVVIAISAADATTAQSRYDFLMADAASCHKEVDNIASVPGTGSFVAFCVPSTGPNIPTWNHWKQYRESAQ